MRKQEPVTWRAAPQNAICTPDSLCTTSGAWRVLRMSSLPLSTGNGAHRSRASVGAYAFTDSTYFPQKVSGPVKGERLANGSLLREMLMVQTDPYGHDGTQAQLHEDEVAHVQYR